MDRRRRKSLANTRIDENSVTIHMDKDGDDDQDADQENSDETTGPQYMNRGVGLPLGAGAPYQRQKRHSWWNILVPDNFKAR